MAILDQSVIKEKEMIDNDLQKMWESLQLLKVSVEKDANILAQNNFSDLLQHIVADLSVLSQTPDIVMLQQTLQSQENLTASDLDKIIQQFISVKLEYASNKSVYLTETSLQKYKQLIEHKSAMDDLLLKISQTPTLEKAPIDWQEKQNSSSPDVHTLVPEAIDPEVLKTQQNLIDWNKVIPVQEVKREEDKKSFWARAKESSFGLAYIFGADNMTNTKDWVSEKWNSFKEWIGWKKKEKKESKKVEEITNTSSQENVSWSNSEQLSTSVVSFDAYQENAYNAYSSLDKQNFDTTANVSKDMYKEVSTWLEKDRLPPLIKEYDGTLDAFSGKSLAVIGNHFGTIKDLTDYTFLEKAWNTTNAVLGSIVDFLSKHTDDKWIGWLASLIKKPFDWVKNLIPNGDDQKENKLKDAIQKEISANATIQKDVDMFIKQLTLVRFYFMEKKKIMQQDPDNKDSLDSLSISQAMVYLTSKNLLDNKLSVKTKLGIDANKVSIVVQKLIAKTESSVDLSARRWNIYFNYEKQQLESRGKATPLEVNTDGTLYKIKGFDNEFSSLEEVVWLANLSNRFVSDTSKLQALRNKKSDRFVYYSNVWRPGYPGLYVNKESNNFINFIPSLNANRVLTAGALSENIKSRTTDMGNSYATYMNERVSSIKEVWL